LCDGEKKNLSSIVDTLRIRSQECGDKRLRILEQVVRLNDGLLRVAVDASKAFLDTAQPIAKRKISIHQADA
jgi:hypothetical protein